MAFQLVRASDDDIAVWQTDHGHIFVFSVDADRRGLTRLVMRDAPDAAVPAETFADEAQQFATAEARARRMVEPLAELRRPRPASGALV